MDTILSLLIFVCATIFRESGASVVSLGDFNKGFYITWSPSHVETTPDGQSRNLTLDQNSGCGFASNDTFLFGGFSMKLRLVPGNSAGTVVSFYMSTLEARQDELDFEFLGDVDGKLYTLQTNVFVDGVGNREQRFRLWFDPTKDFHTYSILWNLYQIVFFVDSVPIRTFRNHEDKGVPYPTTQMGLWASIWNGEDWATNGGQTKINWAGAPFVASYRSPKVYSCVVDRGPLDCFAQSPDNWWNSQRLNSLNWLQRRLYKWARNYYLNYDYCKDYARFNYKLPKECSLTKY